MKRIPVRVLALMTALGLAGLLSGCGSDQPDSTPANADTGTGQELKTIQVGSLPVTDTAVLTLGEDQGFFAKRGLKLNIEMGQGGAAVVPGITSGVYQLGYSNAISVMQAVDRGLNLTILAGAAASHADLGDRNGINSIIVRDDGQIKTLKDLEGKKVAVNTLGNYSEALVRATVDGAGADSNKIEFMELGFTDFIPALEKKNIDAFLSGEPFGTMALEHGHKSLANTHAEIAPGVSYVQAVWFASQDAIDADPQLYADLQDAINESLAYANDHSDELRKLIPEFTGIDEGTAAKMTLSAYRDRIEPKDLKVMADAAYTYKMVQAEPDLDALLWAPGK